MEPVFDVALLKKNANTAGVDGAHSAAQRMRSWFQRSGLFAARARGVWVCRSTKWRCVRTRVVDEFQGVSTRFTTPTKDGPKW